VTESGPRVPLRARRRDSPHAARGPEHVV
jgi:hypothetical protein